MAVKIYRIIIIIITTTTTEGKNALEYTTNNCRAVHQKSSLAFNVNSIISNFEDERYHTM